MSGLFIHSKTERDQSTLAGGKAANLWRLSQAGFTVPAWMALPSHFMRQQLASCEQAEAVVTLVEKLQKCKPEKIEKHCAKLREIIMKMQLNQRVVDELATWLDLQDTKLFAVRSSANDEDGAADSFAGMHDSFLCIAKQAVAAHVCKVWASAYTERAISYRRERGLSLTEIQIGVVIQTMVQPAASGVMFTVNPVNQHVLQVMISAVYGLGEGLVSGELDADTYVIESKVRSLINKSKQRLCVWSMAISNALLSVKTCRQVSNRKQL